MKTQEKWISLADFTDIKLEKTEDGVGKVTINRPEVRNAFRPQTVEELKKAFEMLREDQTRLDAGVSDDLACFGSAEIKIAALAEYHREDAALWLQRPHDVFSGGVLIDRAQMLQRADI